MKMNKTMGWIQWGASALVLTVLAACASAGGGGGMPAPSDEELIGELMNKVMDALKAGDVDSMVMSYSDDFSSDQGGKPEMQQFLQGAKEQGFLDGIEVDLAGMTVSVEGDSATAEPVEVSGAFGALSLSFGLQKRDGAWIITSQNTSQ